MHAFDPTMQAQMVADLVYRKIDADAHAILSRFVDVSDISEVARCQGDLSHDSGSKTSDIWVLDHD